MRDRPKPASVRRIQRERRSGSDRRAGGKPGATGAPPGGERRQTDRRVLVYGILLSTARSVASIEAWLEPNCEGDWTIVLDEIDDGDLGRKHLRIMFELESDKQKFIAGFRR